MSVAPPILNDLPPISMGLKPASAPSERASSRVSSVVHADTLSELVKSGACAKSFGATSSARALYASSRASYASIGSAPICGCVVRLFLRRIGMSIGLWRAYVSLIAMTQTSSHGHHSLSSHGSLKVIDARVRSLVWSYAFLDVRPISPPLSSRLCAMTAAAHRSMPLRDDLSYPSSAIFRRWRALIPRCRARLLSPDASGGCSLRICLYTSGSRRFFSGDVIGCRCALTPKC